MSENVELATQDQLATSESTALAKPRRLLTKKQIVAAPDIKYYEVHVPEWTEEGEDPDTTYVLIKTICGREKDAFEASMIRGVGKHQQIDMQNLRAKFCSLIIVHPDTKERMFSKAEIDLLGNKSAAALDRVYQEGMKYSGLTKEDVDNMVGNSGSGQLDV